jgi:hypothetical protein
MRATPSLLVVLIFAVTSQLLYYYATMTATLGGNMSGTTPAVTAGVQLLSLVRIA